MKDQILIDTIEGFVDMRERKLEDMKQRQHLLDIAIASIETELAVDKKRLETLKQDEENKQELKEEYQQLKEGE